MIEPIMFFGLGFLAASLLTLVIVPLVHARAVRLTTRRLEASTPVSIAEIQADKDQLRAEFAMATRRLEMNVEQLQAKTTSQLAKLGKQTETINRLKAELAAAVDTIAALQAQEKSLQEQLLSTAEELGLKNTALEEAERKLAERKAELAKFSADLNERTIWADSQRVEIVARETQLAALRDRVDDLERDVKQAEERFQQARNDAEKANKALAEEREERARVEREMDTLSQETEATWAKQREENAVIRECINDVAAEVARLTMALEGAGSPMETILAADEIGRPRDGNRIENGPGKTDGDSSLADRIRALQHRAARIAPAD